MLSSLVLLFACDTTSVNYPYAGTDPYQPPPSVWDVSVSFGCDDCVGYQSVGAIGYFDVNLTNLSTESIYFASYEIWLIHDSYYYDACVAGASFYGWERNYGASLGILPGEVWSDQATASVPNVYPGTYWWVILTDYHMSPYDQTPENNTECGRLPVYVL